jgi:hypothetical protein
MGLHCLLCILELRYTSDEIVFRPQLLCPGVVFEVWSLSGLLTVQVVSAECWLSFHHTSSASNEIGQLTTIFLLRRSFSQRFLLPTPKGCQLDD